MNDYDRKTGQISFSFLGIKRHLTVDTLGFPLLYPLHKGECHRNYTGLIETLTLNLGYKDKTLDGKTQSRLYQTLSASLFLYREVFSP